MPKKNGKCKSFSFDERTLTQLTELSKFHKLSQTALIEFLLNREYREKIENRH